MTNADTERAPAGRSSSRIGWDLLPQAIAAAAEWLMRTEQPDDALGDHLGESTRLGGGLSVSVAGNGWHGGPGGERGDATSARFHIRADSEDQPLGSVEPDPGPFTDAELAEVTELLEASGLHVVERWGGPQRPGVSHRASFGVVCESPKPESLRRTYDDERDCPVHSSPLCSWDGCDWWPTHRASLVRPSWPPVEQQDDQAPVQSEDDRNLEAVRRTLERITPLLASLDIHPSTVVAGHRGTIGGKPGSLRFEPGIGHGVCIPAEAAERLVELAMRAVDWDGQTA